LSDIIRKNLIAFTATAEALIEIRDKRLYRDLHDTFEAYVQGKFKDDHEMILRTLCEYERWISE
jgi:hypothetical protein